LSLRHVLAVCRLRRTCCTRAFISSLLVRVIFCQLYLDAAACRCCRGCLKCALRAPECWLLLLLAVAGGCALAANRSVKRSCST
jgi:hypothetical protein